MDPALAPNIDDDDSDSPTGTKSSRDIDIVVYISDNDGDGDEQRIARRREVMAVVNADIRRRRTTLIIAALFALHFHLTLLHAPHLERYYISKLRGAQWVKEVLDAPAKKIRLCFGVTLEVFQYLVDCLGPLGLNDNGPIKFAEQLAIFLFTCVTGLPFVHGAERFQHAPATISRFVTHSFHCIIY